MGGKSNPKTYGHFTNYDNASIQIVSYCLSLSGRFAGLHYVASSGMRGGHVGSIKRSTNQSASKPAAALGAPRGDLKILEVGEFSALLQAPLIAYPNGSSTQLSA